ncbi:MULTISPECIES: acyl carrier protein [unclassified Streptomyces]|uniref:acyl carrier protein n=1 Tax=unclassified Streptomyces TaxID=2593676 RepID=UPI002251B4F3|nr:MULTISPECIES: acyl carrier protein [unclassified Streptomyces]MCX5141928.1 acyl carrier protein [Streptomyces sp. NBC_00338]WRZ66402.1 acyl carrier protein [Streptomyces sp. NBC_01257]WSU60396.1 acyl carrier protein [Streptomyces sp. NBC_01104]
MSSATPVGYSIDDFIRTVRDELGVPLTDAQFGADFDELPDWDSLYLLKLVTAVEQATGSPVPVGKVLEARSLKEIYELAVPA